MGTHLKGQTGDSGPSQKAIWGSVVEWSWKECALGRVPNKVTPEQQAEIWGWKLKGRGQYHSIDCNSKQRIKTRGAGLVPSFFSVSDRDPAQGVDPSLACLGPRHQWALCCHLVVVSWKNSLSGSRTRRLLGVWPGRVLSVDAGVCWGSLSCEGGDTGVLKSLLFLKGAISLLFQLSLFGHYLAQRLAQSRHFLS